jgi:hypothetical protein
MERLRGIPEIGPIVCSQRISRPQHGEDFLDDDIGGADRDDTNASRDGFCTTTVQREERDERRETAPVYRLKRSASG